jgi:hypothetical protein
MSHDVDSRHFTPDDYQVAARMGGLQNKKTIIVKWVKADPSKSGHDKEMRIVESNHRKYYNGWRFDYGKCEMVAEEGYTVTILPMEES